MKYTRKHFEDLAQPTQAADTIEANAKHLILAIADAYDRMAELVEKAKGAAAEGSR